MLLQSEPNFEGVQNTTLKPDLLQRMSWRCPRCRGELLEGDDGVCCESCAARYESIGGIPDLRLPGASWIDYEVDKANARRLLTETARLSAEELVRHVYSLRSDWDAARVEFRTRQVITAPDRLRADIRGWLQPCVTGAGLFLDLGCGPGMLLAAAAADSWQGVGIDVSMVWLVVAQRLIAEWGGRPVLAAALAEALPLADSSVHGVVSLDVIEHVAAPQPYLYEISRVTARGGFIALSTPNRYSLAAEPHVAIWGVGWLPRPWQKPYVQWRSGKNYDYTQLLSTWEAARLIRKYTSFQTDLLVPPVPEEEIAHFPAYRATLARLYNRLIALGWARRLFLLIGPFFRIVGKKM